MRELSSWSKVIGLVTVLMVCCRLVVLAQGKKNLVFGKCSKYEIVGGFYFEDANCSCSILKIGNMKGGYVVPL